MIIFGLAILIAVLKAYLDKFAELKCDYWANLSKEKSESNKLLYKKADNKYHLFGFLIVCYFLVSIFISQVVEIKNTDYIIFPLVYWCFFETTLNTLRKRDVFYVGESSRFDLFLKKLFGENKEYANSLLKIISILVSLYILL